MKTIDISAYTIIKEGIEICVQRTPAGCTQNVPIDGLLPTMERNEGSRTTIASSTARASSSSRADSSTRSCAPHGG
jgi:hypothetical protein